MSGELLKNIDTELEGEVSKEPVERNRKSVIQTNCPQWLLNRDDSTEYGKVELISYYSNTTRSDRKANVLFPANYDIEKKYPVLYFLHGIFGDENSMIHDPNNKLDTIIGNLIAEKEIKEAIIVFPNMFAADNPDIQPGFSPEQVKPYDNFINDLVDDLVPFIEKTYPVLTGRDNRAVIGFSMGGRETIYIGLMRSDMFGSFAAIAPAPGLVPNRDMMMVHEGQFDSESEMNLKHTDSIPELFMICCGDIDEVVGQFPASYHRILDGNKVEHLWYEVPGANHDSFAIRSGFYNFLIRWEAINN